MNPTYTDDQKAQALKAYEQDGPSAAARDLGIPKTTIHRWAKRAGIDAPPAERTAAATAQASATARQKRELLGSAILDDAEALRRKLSEPYDVVSDTGEVVTLPHPTARDMRDLTVSFGILVDKHIALNALDDDSGVEHAKSLLSSLAERLGMEGM